MIYVTQGHEKGVGLETFLKAFSLLSKSEQSLFKLFVDQKSLEENFNFISQDYEWSQSFIHWHTNKLNCELIPPSSINPQSTSSLVMAMEQALSHKESILLTLPTSKDQLIFNKKSPKGYTEFFREYFKKDDLGMFFYSSDFNVLLLSDHLPLSEVSAKLDEQFIFDKVQTALESFKHTPFKFNEVLISGINPHAGEGGLLGHEDKAITNAIKKLSSKYPHLDFSGPLPGDTLYYHYKGSEQLFVYAYHDQGLALFKALKGLLGSNITLGLPFFRLSVDHGTAFDLYGKNKANYLGTYFQLKLAVKLKLYYETNRNNQC